MNCVLSTRFYIFLYHSVSYVIYKCIKHYMCILICDVKQASLWNIYIFLFEVATFTDFEHSRYDFNSFILMIKKKICSYFFTGCLFTVDWQPVQRHKSFSTVVKTFLCLRNHYFFSKHIIGGIRRFPKFHARRCWKISCSKTILLS